MYRPEAPAGQHLENLEPCFDAANVIRIGTDLLYRVSDSGNELSAQWLQSAVDDRYTVTPVRDVHAYTHIDTTFVPLRPGLVLVNFSRVTKENMPEPLRGWDHIYVPEPVNTGFVGPRTQLDLGGDEHAQHFPRPRGRRQASGTDPQAGTASDRRDARPVDVLPRARRRLPLRHAGCP